MEPLSVRLPWTLESREDLVVLPDRAWRLAFLGAILAVVRPTLATVLITVAICIPLFVATLATTVKRLHDRNKSGWWIVVFHFVPAVFYIAALVFPAQGPGPLVSAVLYLLAAPLSLWGFVEIYCLRGTEGDNRFCGID